MSIKKSFSSKVIAWISFGFSVSSCVVSVWSIVLANIRIEDCQELEFSYDKLGTIIGIVLSAIAIVASTYFIIIGLAANSARVEIRSDIKLAESEVKKYSEATEDQCKITAQTIYNSYSEAIASVRTLLNAVPKGVSGEKMDEMISSLKLAQARFSSKAKFIDLDIQLMGINLISNLSNDKTDMEFLKAIMDDPNERKIVKETASHAYNVLEERLKKKSGGQ